MVANNPEPEPWAAGFMQQLQGNISFLQKETLSRTWPVKGTLKKRVNDCVTIFQTRLWSSGVYQWNKPIIKPQKSKLSNTVSVWWTVGEHMSHLAWLGSSLGSSWGRGVHGWIRCWILSACLHADNLMNVSVKCCEVFPESLVQSPHRHTVCYPGLDVVKQMQILNFLGATFTPSPLTNCKERQVGLEHQGIQPLSSPRLLTIPISKSCQHRALCLLLAFCCGVHLECLGTLLERLNLAGISKRRYIQY